MDTSTTLPRDPVVEAYRAGIDFSLVRENLKLTPEERIRKHDRMLALVLAARKAGEAMRGGNS